MPVDQFQYLTLQQLEALVYLVQERTFANAAQRMGLTQPSISKHIKNLEILIDAAIIDRTRPGIALTTEGRILYAYARRMLKLREEAREKIVHAKDASTRHIFTGASSIPAAYILPQALSALREKHPALMVHIRAGDSHDIMDMVAAEQVEIGFIGRSTSDKRFMCEPIWEDTLVLVAHKDHPAVRSIGKTTLNDLPFIGREAGSGTRSIIETHFTPCAGRPALNVISEMGSSEAVKEALLAGLGVSIISVHAVRRELAQGLLVRLTWQGFPLSRNIFMVCKRHFKALDQHTMFMQFMRAFKLDE